jgi:PIN domain nuclease of toxin-antitoxin system
MKFSIDTNIFIFWLNDDRRLTPETISLLPISHKHVQQAHKLPLYHKDPFDRMLIAQAMIENTPIITADKQFDAYNLRVIHP